MAWEEFYEVAGKLSHDLEALERGQEVTGRMRIRNPQESAQTLSRATPGQRRERAKTFFDAIAARQGLGQGMHDRGEAIGFAYGEMKPQDAAGMDRHFPIRVKTVSVKEKEIAAETCWDVSARGSEWGVDDGEELYCIVNVGRLILNPGASLAVRGNVFIFVCQELIKREGAKSPDWMGESYPEGGLPPFDIGILPTPFSYTQGKMDRIEGEDGRPGASGRHGVQVQELEMSSTIFGPIYTGDRKGKISGSRGRDGAPGEPGKPGGCGGACKLAELNIRKIVCGGGKVTVLAKAGNGGAGGRGGAGGDGGGGSDGLAAYRTLYEDYPAGDGGAGGNGGAGGRGGNGGNGGISSNIYICVPEEQEGEIECISLEGQGGRGGDGGQGGNGGQGGHGGAGCLGGVQASPEAAEEKNVYRASPGTPGQNGTLGQNGIPGQSGTMGKKGRDGHARPAPPVFLNEKRIL